LKLPEVSVRRPTTVAMAFLAIFLIGMVSVTKLPLDLMPEIEPPAITVLTTYPGASARDVELKITKYVENDVSIINNLKDINSTSKENLSMVTCQFEYGTNLDEASNDIRDRLEFTKLDLPDDAEDPILFKFDTSMIPILFIGFSANESYAQLHHLIDKRVADPLKRVPGVGAVQLIGGMERQINIELDMKKVHATGIPVEDILKILDRENLMLPAGSIKIGTKEYIVRVPGEYENVGQIRNVIIGKRDSALVYLKDVATVEDSFKEQVRRVWIDKRPALFAIVQKQSGANTVSVCRAALECIEELKKTLPADVDISIIQDSSEFIIQAIRNLRRSLLWGAVFVIFIVFFFLRRGRSCLIIITSIPFSLIAAFILLYACGYTINIMSLSSIIIAIGLVVDNSIVVLENITQHFERGERPSEAAVFGASEVGLAVGASTLTTVVVFLPLMFLTGISGIIFIQLGLVISVTVMASYFTAITLTPMLSSRLLRPVDAYVARGKFLSRFNRFSERTFEVADCFHEVILDKALSNRKWTLAILLLIFVGGMFLVKFVPKEFMPEEDTGDLSATIEMAEGTKVEESEKLGMLVEGIIWKDVPEIEHSFMRCGQSREGISSAFGSKEGPHVITVGGKLVSKSKRKRSSKDIAEALRKKVSRIPGIKKLTFETSDPFARMLFGGGKPVSIEVLGDDLEESTRIAGEIKKILKNTEGAKDVTTSMDMGRPEIVVSVDRDKASSLGLSMEKIAETVRTNFYGKEATEFREADEDYDLFVRLREQDRATMEDLANLTLTTVSGEQLQLRNVARIEEATGPIEILRKNQQRVVKVEANPYGRTEGEIVSDVMEGMKRVPLSAGIMVNFAGAAEERREAFGDVGILVLLGVALVYMVMASQFESLIHPLVVMFAIPYAFIGVILILLITGLSLSVVSLIGVVMLIGIVVNDAIVLVDYTNILRARGLEMFDAIKLACRRRLRPVLMTTFTTIGGMLPLVLGRGEGSESWRPIGLTVIGGLLVATFVTLILVPTIYSIFESLKVRGKGRNDNKPLVAMSGQKEKGETADYTD